jgi:hypothetical protein
MSLTHALASTTAALHSTHHTVNETATGPFLVRQDIAANVFLSPLHKVDIGKHTLIFERSRQLTSDSGIRMKTSK